jgi:choline dehydrogenase-like flavoprotein
VTSGNTAAPAMMIGERAADFIVPVRSPVPA